MPHGGSFTELLDAQRIVQNFRPKAGEGWKIVRNPGGENRTREGGNLVRDAQKSPAAARPRADAIQR